MSAFSLPVVIRTAAGDIDLMIDLPAPAPFAQVLPDLLQYARLPPGTPLYFGVGPVEGSQLCGRPPLLAGCVLTTVPDDAVREVGPVALSCVAGPDAGGSAVLTAGGVTVGRDPACDLAAADPELSRRHARVRPSGTGVAVADLQSVNGIGVDGVRLERAVGSDRTSTGAAAQAPTGALLRFGGSLFRVGLVSEQRVLLTADGEGRLAVSRPARVVPGFTAPLGDPPGPVPLRTRRPIPLVSAVVGAVAGGAIAWVTGLWMFLLLAALGPVMLVAGAVSDRVSGRRSHRRMAAEHRKQSERYACELARAVVADRIDAWDRYPDPATLARRVAGAGVRLWERRRQDDDFLRLALGVGTRPARLPVPHPPPVPEVPIIISMAAVGVLGLAGECRSTARWLIAQLVSLHSPADLRLSVFSGNPDLVRIADLPHAAGDGGNGLITSTDQAGPEIERLLATNHGRSVGRGTAGTPAAITVVVLDDAHRWRRLPGMGELLASARAGRGVLIAICLSPSVEGLPMECAAVVTIAPGQLRIAAGDEQADGEPTGVSAAYLEDLTRALTPLFDRDAADGGLPGRVLLSDLMTGALSARLAENWRIPTMTAALGMAGAGPLHIDLERDGPHVLIAGTTGSGKSELLQTLVTGLALAAAPDHTSFLLVDYKGGAAFGRLTELPHTTAVVTDLDPATAVRALTGLRAEVRRREQLLADAGVPDLAALRRAGGPAGPVAPPALVIVVDEYATLGAELPDFLTGLLDIAQRGRSLGLHLVLATQRPAGVLSPAMKANIALRICLRVEDDADSVDVLDTGDAAGLSPAHPGRALLRRERGTVTMFQVATVSVPADRGHRVRRRAVAGTDSAPSSSSASPSSSAHPAGRADADLVVEAARAAAPGERPPPPWLPALPTHYRPHAQSPTPTPDDVLGLIDEPALQRQRRWRTAAGSTLVVGPPASGRTNFLRRIGWSAAKQGADLLVVDTGGDLADLATWPAVSSHLDGRDPVLVQRLIRRVVDELRNRANQPGPALLMLIDDWDIVGRELDALDFGVSTAAIAEAAAHGPPLAVQVVVAGDLRLQHHRMAGGFAGLLLLGVDHRGEVASLPAGRGQWEGAAVQCALSPADPVGPVACSGGGPRTGIVVRPLPAGVPTAQLPAARPGAIPIGLGGDDAAPACVDLTGPGGGLLVAGPRRSGITGTLDVLALGAAATGIRVLRACPRPAAALPGVQDVDLRRGTAELVDLLIGHIGPLLLVVDEVDVWRDTDAGLLERFLSAVGTGQHLALGCRLDRALRSLRGPVAEVAALRTGVLLGADAADGALLGTVVPRLRGPGVPGRGHLVVDGVAQVLQVARVGAAAG